MEGPTPVSALIHAATMVTAGVYLVARAAPILHFSSAAGWVIAIIGAATALLAATIACGQNDIKRVLAYSTVSQLGYMFLAEGSGDFSAGIFHTVMHAFFKALLFLGSGAVIHALHDEQDMKRMGGLRKHLRITFPTFIIGYLALSAIPPFDGFWSKDAVLAAAWHKSPALWAVGVATAFLTAYYMSRLVRLTFWGEGRWPTSGHEPLHPHEAPATMTFPLIILGALSVVGWLLDAPFGGLNFIDKWLAPVFPATIAVPFSVHTGTKWVIGLVATAAALLGLVAGLAAWARAVDRPRLEPAVLAHAWYIDEGVSLAVGGPLTRMATAFSFVIDAGWVDGLVRGLSTGVAASGRQMRRVQTGYLRNYALGIGIGAAAILFYVSLRAGS
jgi:NADH-quinone oxidoreductase subunit L